MIHDQEGVAQLVERQLDPEVVDLSVDRVRTNAFRDAAAPPISERLAVKGITLIPDQALALVLVVFRIVVCLFVDVGIGPGVIAASVDFLMAGAGC